MVARAMVKSIYSVDALDGIDAWIPPDVSDFQLLVDAEIGLSDDPGGDLFSILVVGREWFRSQPVDKGFRWGRGVLVLDRWDPFVVRRAIGDLAASASGDDWHAIALKISRFTRWEFEDYRA